MLLIARLLAKEETVMPKFVAGALYGTDVCKRRTATMRMGKLYKGICAPVDSPLLGKAKASSKHSMTVHGDRSLRVEAMTSYKHSSESLSDLKDGEILVVIRLDGEHDIYATISGDADKVQKAIRSLDIALPMRRC